MGRQSKKTKTEIVLKALISMIDVTESLWKKTETERLQHADIMIPADDL